MLWSPIMNGAHTNEYTLILKTTINIVNKATKIFKFAIIVIGEH